jgi:uncharacterized membrane protein
VTQVTVNSEPRERLVAGLLWYGTWLASAFIAGGLTLGLLQHVAKTLLLGVSSFAAVKIGVALFILLPLARVALLLFIFLRERDYVYTAISALVLVVVVAGLLAGI